MALVKVVLPFERDQGPRYCVLTHFMKRKHTLKADQDITTAPNTSRLTEAELDIYRRALRGEQLDPSDPVLTELIGRGILLPNTHDVGTYVPTSYTYVESQLTAAVQRALAQATEAMAGIPAHVRELEAEQQRYNHCPSPAGALQLTSVPNVNAETIRAIQTAEFEILTAQPGYRRPKVLKGALPRDLEAAQRGVAVRTIYRTSGRMNATQREWVGTMTRAGAQVRTLNEDFLRLIIADRRHAFFEVYNEDGTVQPAAAWYTQDRAVCAMLAAHFRLQWERADPWVPEANDWAPEGRAGGEPELQGQTVTTKMQRTILRGIVAGKNHKTIGKGLDVSERTVTAQVAKLRNALGFETVMQLTHWWATSPERLLP
ncbi:LuxR C-terminal-related transcriptional regulator [Streptomyces sp. NPDC087297]|uniref:LuxR C-terminal-related transcriptional regulator n=1 Tax=Streptomyces sp. NPDC087297 TaxID=3365778 RepID=UPI0037F5596E